MEGKCAVWHHPVKTQSSVSLSLQCTLITKARCEEKPYRNTLFLICKHSYHFIKQPVFSTVLR